MSKTAIYCTKQHPKYKDAQNISNLYNIDLIDISDIDLTLYSSGYSAVLAWLEDNNNYYLSIFDNLDKSNKLCKKDKKYLYIDYISNLIAGKKCFEFTMQDALPKAMGLPKLYKSQSLPEAPHHDDNTEILNKANKTIRILDGTAGFTLDSFAIWKLAAKCNLILDYTLVEQSKIIYLLVKDALLRADSRYILNNNINLCDNTEISTIEQRLSRQAFNLNEFVVNKQNIRLINNNFINFLELNNNINDNTDKNLVHTPKYDIIYLDPMFEHHSKAKPKKGMQLLQDLCHNPSDVLELLNIALKHSNGRVVLKRARNQSKLLEKMINYSVTTKQLRYDVYLVS